jgi:VanZ family protein
MVAIRNFLNGLNTLLRFPAIAVLYSALIFLLCIIPSKELVIVEDINDKTAHLLAFIGIAFLWLNVKRNYVTVFVLGSLLAIFIEITQGLLPESFHRSAEWLDIVADVAGLLLGTVLFIIYKKLIALILIS